MTNKNHSKVKIISDSFIRPNCEIKQSKKPYYLSSNDLFQLSMYYMHRGLLYAKTSPSINSLIDKLKDAIAIALVDFYPLAGRLSTIKYEDDHASWIYVDCDKGHGARLIHATMVEECNVTISDIVYSDKRVSRDLWSFFDLGDPNVMNHDGHTRSLISVQVTDISDGIFIGFTMNHSLGDGASLWHFINSLSKLVMGHGDDIEKPIFKTVFSDGYGPVIKLPYLDPNEFLIRFDVDPRLKLRVFQFKAESIARLKAEANEKSDENDMISSFQALSAFVWLHVARVRKLPLDSIMHCWLTADTRPKSDPPLPSNHFGNFVHLVKVTSKVNDLIDNGLGRAATMLNQAIMGLDSKVISEALRARDESPQVAQLGPLRKYFGDNPPLIFTGSTRFDAYGPEFGLGKAIATRPGYSSWMNGRIVIDPGREGGGSADLQVCLLTETMTTLESDDKFMSYVS